ncbi:hypothetical protein ACFVVM_09820 [Nocardia sp. NPDC058176]|uniref:hypothetical protein n=1 Tax=Nocardia sp. NPDC058176 TaxID=3346368 RepID=UPI0036DA350D
MKRPRRADGVERGTGSDDRWRQDRGVDADAIMVLTPRGLNRQDPLAHYPALTTPHSAREDRRLVIESF